MTKPSRNRTPDWGRILLVGAALVQGFQYAQAFQLVHSGLGQFALAGGALAGGVVVGAIAYAANRIPSLRSKASKRWGVAFFAVLMLLSPFVLTPVNYYGMQAGLRTSLGWYAWLLAGLVASLPEIALGLVALVDRSLVAASDAQRRSATLPATLSDAQPGDQRRSATLNVAQPRLYRCECGFTANRYVVSGHKRTCAIHRAAKSGQPIPVEMPAKKEQV